MAISESKPYMVTVSITVEVFAPSMAAASEAIESRVGAFGCYGYPMINASIGIADVNRMSVCVKGDEGNE